MVLTGLVNTLMLTGITCKASCASAFIVCWFLPFAATTYVYFQK